MHFSNINKFPLASKMRPRKGLTVNHINSIISNIIRQPHKGLESKCGVLILRDPIL